MPDAPVYVEWHEFPAHLGNLVAAAGTFERRVAELVGAFLDPEYTRPFWLHAMVSSDSISVNLDRLDMIANNRFMLFGEPSPAPGLPRELTEDLREWVRAARVAMQRRNTYVHADYGIDGHTNKVGRFEHGNRRTARNDFEPFDLRDLVDLNYELREVTDAATRFAMEFRRTISAHLAEHRRLNAEFEAQRRADDASGPVGSEESPT